MHYSGSSGPEERLQANYPLLESSVPSSLYIKYPTHRFKVGYNTLSVHKESHKVQKVLEDGLMSQMRLKGDNELSNQTQDSHQQSRTLIQVWRRAKEPKKSSAKKDLHFFPFDICKDVEWCYPLNWPEAVSVDAFQYKRLENKGSR